MKESIPLGSYRPGPMEENAGSLSRTPKKDLFRGKKAGLHNL